MVTKLTLIAPAVICLPTSMSTAFSFSMKHQHVLTVGHLLAHLLFMFQTTILFSLKRDCHPTVHSHIQLDLPPHWWHYPCQHPVVLHLAFVALPNLVRTTVAGTCYNVERMRLIPCGRMLRPVGVIFSTARAVYGNVDVWKWRRFVSRVTCRSCTDIVKPRAFYAAVWIVSTCDTAFWEDDFLNWDWRGQLRSVEWALEMEAWEDWCRENISENFTFNGSISNCIRTVRREEVSVVVVSVVERDGDGKSWLGSRRVVY